MWSCAFSLISFSVQWNFLFLLNFFLGFLFLFWRRAHSKSHFQSRILAKVRSLSTFVVLQLKVSLCSFSMSMSSISCHSRQSSIAHSSYWTNKGRHFLVRRAPTIWGMVSLSQEKFHKTQLGGILDEFSRRKDTYRRKKRIEFHFKRYAVRRLFPLFHFCKFNI